MSSVIGGVSVPDNPQNGAWYSGRQYWNGTLSNPGEFNGQNNQAGQQGQAAVAAPDQAFINGQRQQAGLPQQTYSNPGTSQPQQSGGGGGLNMGAQPTINLQSVYDQSFKDAGVADLQTAADAAQAKIDQRRNELTTASSKINDNPFLSEANRTGRLAKLTQTAEQDISNLQNESSYAQNKVASAKADAQVKVNLASQQYSIDNDAYKQNVSLFNNLLTSGALNNISSQDIGQIAVSTGMSTGMIQSIIDSSKAKDNKPQVITVDDGVNQKLVAVDPNGNIIHSTILGGSTKKSGTAKETAAQQNQSATQDMSSLISGSLDATGSKNNSLVAGGDGKLSPQAYDYYKNLWLNQGLDTKKFDAQFGYLKNPNNSNY